MVLDQGPRGIDTSAGNIGRAVAVTPTLRIEGVLDEARGRAALGKGIGDVGNAMGELALKQLEAIGIRQEADADNAITAAKGELAEKIAAEPDETKWKDMSVAHFSTLREQLQKKEMAPAVRDSVRMKLEREAAHTVSGVQVSSARESIQKAKGSIVNNLKLARLNGDRGLRDRTAAAGVAAGYLAPEEDKIDAVEYDHHQAQEQKRAVAESRDTQKNSFLQSMQEDPWAAKEMLDAKDPNNGDSPTWFPDLDAGDRQILKHQAESAIRAKQSEFIETMQDGIVMGEMDDQKIAMLAPVAKLGPLDVKKLQDFRAKYIESATSKEPMDTGAALKLSAEIEKFNPEGMPEEEALQRWVDLKQQADMVTARGGEEGRQTGGVFNQRLYQLHPLHDRRKPTAKLPDGVEKDFNDLMRTYAPDTPPEKATAAEKEIGKREFRKFITQRSTLFQDLQKEIQGKPELGSGGLEQWVGDKWKGIRAARLVDDPQAASGVLFPAQDPNELYRKMKERQ